MVVDRASASFTSNDGPLDSGMTMWWEMQFYSERRGILAHYRVEALTPAAAAQRGREALVAEYPPERERRGPSGFEQAQRIGGRDASGWTLYRIVKA